jgi:zinc protease
MLLSIQVPSNKVAECVKFLAELRASPSFPASEVTKEKTSQILEYEKIRQDPILASVSDSWEATFPESPLGHPVTGYPETIEKLTPGILEKFDADTRQKALLVMAIVGPQDENKLIDYARASFERVRIRSHATKIKFGQTRDLNVLRRVLKVKQTTFSVGMATQGVSASEYPALLLIQDYLGSSSRRYVGVLFNELREKRGLTYIASTDLTALRECGLLTAYASAKHEKVSDALSLMLKLIVELRDKAVPHEEVEQLKTFHKQVVGMMLDVPNQAATWLATNIFRGGKTSFESYASEIDSVTPEAMRLAARKFLKPSHVALSVAGRPPDEKALTNIMRKGLQ